MRKFLIEDYSFKDVMGNYFKKIKPFHNSNLTLLDAWIYGKGDIYNKIRPIEEYISGFYLYFFLFYFKLVSLLTLESQTHIRLKVR